MDIMISREQTGFMERGSDGKKGGVAKTFVLKKLILFYLEFNHKLLREICLTVYRIDFDKIKPSIDDKYWMCSPAYSKSYKFMGLADEERAKLREKL